MNVKPVVLTSGSRIGRICCQVVFSDWDMVMKLTVIFQLSELTTIIHTTTGLDTLALGSFTIVLLLIQDD